MALVKYYRTVRETQGNVIYKLAEKRKAGKIVHDMRKPEVVLFAHYLFDILA